MDLPDEQEAEKNFIEMSRESLTEFLLPNISVENEILDLFVQVSTFFGTYQLNNYNIRM